MENGIDFEMSELKRKELAAINNKVIRVTGKETDTTMLTESEKKIFWNQYTVAATDKRTGMQVINDRQRLQNEYNYLNGKIWKKKN